MSIVPVDIALPYYRMIHVREEQRFFIGAKSIVANLDTGGRRPIRAEDAQLPVLHTAVLRDTYLQDVTEALIVEDYERCRTEEYDTRRRICSDWQPLWEYSRLERHRGVPFWMTAKHRLREGAEIKLCYGQPRATAGSHREHSRVFDEIHVQLAGLGRVEKWRSDAPESLYGEYILAPGATHPSLCDSAGRYPWHRYFSLTHVVFLVVEIDR